MLSIIIVSLLLHCTYCNHRSYYFCYCSYCYDYCYYYHCYHYWYYYYYHHYYCYVGKDNSSCSDDSAKYTACIFVTLIITCRDNLEWISKATNWNKFNAVASLGLIHKVLFDFSSKYNSRFNFP